MPNGLEEELVFDPATREIIGHGPPTAVIIDRGIRLVLRFAPDDRLFEGHPAEVRLLPETATLDARTLRAFVPNSDLYLALIRAGIGTLAPRRQDDLDHFHRAAQALRELGGPRRGHRAEFFQQIALEYQALIDGGEPHPVKTLAERHHVVISAASRWITKAKDDGYIKEGKRGK